MQIILQATHGIVSGEPTFFKRAFGDTAQDYERILMMPHDFIFNRDWYERFDGRVQLDEFRSQFARLDRYELIELMELLSSTDPRGFAALPAHATTTNLKRILRYYVPLPKEELLMIWGKEKSLTRGGVPADMGLPEDERVEDAGLDYDEAGNSVPTMLNLGEGVAA
jgi:hypothetical protein